MARKVALEIICFLVIVLFLYAAVSKLFEFHSFRDQLALSPVFRSTASLVAVVVPVVELTVVGLLMTTHFRYVGLICSFLLMVAFTAYIAAILGFSEEVPCACGGLLQTMNWREHLLFNSCFLVLVYVAMLFTPREERAIVWKEKIDP